jgi:hypothetical protein
MILYSVFKSQMKISKNCIAHTVAYALAFLLFRSAAATQLKGKEIHNGHTHKSQRTSAS